MDLSILVTVCGWPLLIVVGLLSLGLTIGALYLYFRVRQQLLLSSFLPLTLLPVFAGLVMTFVRFLATIKMQLDSAAEIALDAGFVMQMNLVPLLVGMLAASLPATIAIVARWHLAWSAAGVEWMSQKSVNRRTSKEDWEAEEADDYLDALIRPR